MMDLTTFLNAVSLSHAKGGFFRNALSAFSLYANFEREKLLAHTFSNSDS